MAWLVKLGFGCFAAIGLFYAGIDLISHVAYSLEGRRTEATVVAQRSFCVLEYQLVNESILRRDPMPCDRAEATVKANAGRKVRVERENFTHLRFTLANGAVRDEEAKVSASTALSPKIAPGSSISIFYLEANPSDLRIALTSTRIAEMVTVVGIALLVLISIGRGSGERGSRPTEVAFPRGVSHSR